jgi:peroxiredoxin
MSLARLAQTIVIVVAAIAVYSFVAAAKDGELRRRCAALCHLSPEYAAKNRLAPDFELPSIDGSKVRLSDFRGKTVVLNFWTKNCRPCLEEMPSLGELAGILRGRKDVVVLTVSTDETAEDVRDTLKSVLSDKAPFVTVVDAESKVVSGMYGTKLYPETWLIDPRGVIRARFDGPRDWSSALGLELIDNLGSPATCPIEFSESGPVGSGASICEAITG